MSPSEENREQRVLCKDIKRHKSFMKVILSLTICMATYNTPTLCSRPHHLQFMGTSKAPTLKQFHCCNPQQHGPTARILKVEGALQKLYSTWRVFLWKGPATASGCLRYRNVCLALYQQYCKTVQHVENNIKYKCMTDHLCQNKLNNKLDLQETNIQQYTMQETVPFFTECQNQNTHCLDQICRASRK